MNKYNSFLKYIGFSLIIYIYVIAYAISLHTYSVGYTGLSPSDYGLTLIGTLLLYILFQYEIGTSFLKKSLLGHGLVALFIFTIPPLLYLHTFGELRFKTISIYYAYATSFFMFTILGQYWLSTKTKQIKLITKLFTCLDLLALLSPSTLLIYFAKIGKMPSHASLISVYYTNAEETIGFLQQQASLPILIGSTITIILGAIALWIFLYRCNKLIFPDLNQYEGWSIKWPYILFMFILCLYMFQYTYLVRSYREVTQYVKELQQYSTVHNTLSANVQFNDTSLAAIHKTPGTILIVIGESSNRDFMRAFNPNAPYNATPWQTTMMETNKNFTFFKHAYSSYVTTTVTLERALTERNQYNDKAFLASTNIVDIANKLGYHTYWLSNQGIVGHADTSISLVAKGSEKALWLEAEDRKTYDGELLPLLKDVPQQQNNFIVLHIMGSHAYYTDRYPKEFNKFHRTDGSQSNIETYSNSLLYTDHVLQEVYTYAKEHLNLQAMIYMSDHSERVGFGHNADAFTFEQTHIPFWIYLSPTYQKMYPQTEKILKERKNTYWTNDMLYDFVIGILQAPNNKYIPSQDLSNPAYHFTPDSLKTFLGKYTLSDDPTLKAY